MQPEGMVHALEEIHRLLMSPGSRLTPAGSLIEIHPVPTDPLVQVVQGGKVLFAGARPKGERIKQKNAEEALAQVVRRGLFLCERSGEFDFVTYGASVTELLDFFADANAFAEDGATGEALTPEEEALYARVAEIVGAAGDGAEVAYLEKGRITRLRALEGR
jgi:hypothetical protein